MKAKYLDHMGSDNTIANTARVSMEMLDGLGWTELPPKYTEAQRDKLLTYLATHNHWTPFGHAQVTLGMTAPVPIRTQCFKSKQGFVENEESRRYIDSTPTYYIPDFRARPTGSIKQGSAGIHEYHGHWRKQYITACDLAIAKYEEMIEGGVAPEQARFILPQGVEVSWIWTGSLAAFARFCKLRQDSHAQGEIQVLANQVADIIRPHFPVAWAALID